MLYRDLLFYSVYGFLKWKMIRGNGFTAVSRFIFVSPKIGGRIYSNFPVFLEWNIWVIEGLQRFILLNVWNKKITGFSALLLAFKTDIKRIECQIIFSANIYLFKVNNRKTRGRFDNEDTRTTTMTTFWYLHW